MLLIEPIMDIARGEGAAASGPVGTLWQGKRKAGATNLPASLQEEHADGCGFAGV